MLIVGGLALGAVLLGCYVQYVLARRVAAPVTYRGDLVPAGTITRAPHLRVAAVDDRQPARTHRHTYLRRPSTPAVLFWGLFAFYAAVGAVLVFHYGSFVGDAESRVADAWYIFFSRDPHLAAVGFVWNPLPSLMAAPFFALKDVFPALTQKAFAGNLLTALCAAGCVVQFRATLIEFAARRSVVWILTAALALNPMFVYYAANGMSEAPYLLFLLIATRYLVRWFRSGSTTALVLSGVGFGLGYLTRYETAASGFTAMGIVAVVVFARSRGTRRDRVRSACSETIVFSLPFIASFVGWAVVSYVIKGEAFVQLDANQGNSLLIRANGGIHASSLGDTLPIFAMKQLLAFGPLLPLLVAVAAYVAWQRRELGPLALVPLGAALAFTYAAFVQGQLFPWFRYYIPALPLSLLLVGYALPRANADPSRTRASSLSSALNVALAAMCIGLVGTATTALAMWDYHLGSIERGSLSWIVNGGPRTATERDEKYRLRSAQRIAADLDRLRLPVGDVVIDTDTACESLVLMNMSRPHVMVVPSDRDWERTLADPPIFGTHYLLLPPPVGNSALDNIGRAYPGLYDDGGGIATKVAEYNEPGCPKFRLYRLKRSPDVGHGSTIVNG